MLKIRVCRNRPTPTHGRRWSIQRFGDHPIYCVWIGPLFAYIAWGSAARTVRSSR